MGRCVGTLMIDSDYQVLVKRLLAEDRDISSVGGIIYGLRFFRAYDT